MRILLARHAAIDSSCAELVQVAISLQAQGQEIRALDVTENDAGVAPIPMRHILCGANDPTADLPMDPPSFAPPTGTGLSFADMSDAQFNAYREVLRRSLDAEVVSFHPHIIHCEHVWVWGQLALESGVPYVLVAHDEELAAVRDVRFHHLAQQASENAGRILVASEQMAARLHALFAGLEGRITVLPRVTAVSSPRQIEDYAAALLDIYKQVLDDRFGAAWHD